jgi:hypothetical protein
MRSAFLIFFVTTIALGQNGVQAPYERVLIPLMIATPVPGAYGSQWKTELFIRNESDQGVAILPGTVWRNDNVGTLPAAQHHSVHR